MIDFATAHQAIVARLVADPEYPVYDGEAPEGAPAPYVVIGEVTQVPDPELDRDGASITVTLHGFSDSPNKGECYAIQRWLQGHLHHQSVGGAWACYEEFATILREGSTVEPTFHLAARYRVGLQEE